jgi:hypothetical protein
VFALIKKPSVGENLRDLVRSDATVGRIGGTHGELLGLELVGGLGGYPGKFGDEGLAPESAIAK